MTELSAYDDGLTENSPRAFQPWGHGPIFVTRRWPIPLHRAWCVQCADWVGPDRTGDAQSLRLVEDDAVAHAHVVGVSCGVCEVCRPDGAIHLDNLRRQTEAVL